MRPSFRSVGIALREAPSERVYDLAVGPAHDVTQSAAIAFSFVFPCEPFERVVEPVYRFGELVDQIAALFSLSVIHHPVRHQKRTWRQGLMGFLPA